MGLYNNKGLYTGYKKAHKEREALDYYATPTKEVVNILETIGNFPQRATILEPCAGGGHMLEGIIEYMKNNNKNWEITATDIKKRCENNNILTGDEFNFIDDNYPISDVDFIIMNPPFSIIEPFTIRALEIAKKGVIMLARLQYLEGQGRYEKIFKNNPPSDVYIYVDRISCYKNGDTSIKEASAQAYAWFYWNKDNNATTTNIHWIRRK